MQFMDVCFGLPRSELQGYEVQAKRYCKIKTRFSDLMLSSTPTRPSNPT